MTIDTETHAVSCRGRRCGVACLGRQRKLRHMQDLPSAHLRAWHCHGRRSQGMSICVDVFPVALAFRSLQAHVMPCGVVSLSPSKHVPRSLPCQPPQACAQFRSRGRVMSLSWYVKPWLHTAVLLMSGARAKYEVIFRTKTQTRTRTAQDPPAESQQPVPMQPAKRRCAREKVRLLTDPHGCTLVWLRKQHWRRVRKSFSTRSRVCWKCSRHVPGSKSVFSFPCFQLGLSLYCPQVPRGRAVCAGHH